MESKPVDLEHWLLRKVGWMVEETSAYLDTRELLALCQTVALIRLNQTLERLAANQDLAGIREALAGQSASLESLLKQQTAPAKKPAK